ncbi:MAG TPA: hypothetical protein VK602_16395, partial [Phyllobacterium sp.]|nr:hypothetical protein [Phyllobacterium sp.]
IFCNFADGSKCVGTLVHDFTLSGEILIRPLFQRFIDHFSSSALNYTTAFLHPERAEPQIQL